MLFARAFHGIEHVERNLRAINFNLVPIFQTPLFENETQYDYYSKNEQAFASETEIFISVFVSILIAK